jgi:hypothetical protein
MSKSVFSVMFALSICLATAAAAQRRSEPADTLVELWQDSNSRCRGGPGDSPLTDAACKERERYAMRLDKLGHCYGKRGQSGSQMSWHICTADSYHFEGDGGSSGSTGKFTALPTEHSSVAPSLESLSGRWYTANANVCKGTVGNTEGLLTFSGKRFTGYENECLINKASVEGQMLKIQMTCAGEGEESRETEWFEFVNQKQANRSVVDGKRRQTFIINRCP